MSVVQCAFNCSSCKPSNAAHYCRTCKAVNIHRNDKCDGLGPRCIFNCVYCPSGSSHVCRVCKSVNLHRSADCPLNADEKSYSTTYDPFLVSKGSFENTGVIVYYKHAGKTYVLVQRRCKSLGGYYIYPGGKMDSKVPWNDAVREMKEETGLDLMNSAYQIEVKGHITLGNAIDFVVRLKSSGSGLPAWTNGSTAHQWESRAFPNGVGVLATHGHNWIRTDDNLLKDGVVGALFKKAKTLML